MTNITIEQLKQSKEIRINTEDKIGYFVVDHKLTSFQFDEIEDVEIMKFILENGEQVRYYDIMIKDGNIFEYIIHNGGEYEFSNEISLYSYKYFNREEFNKICKEAQNTIEQDLKKNPNLKIRKDSIYDISNYLKKLNPNTFIKIGRGSAFNSGEWDLD